MNVISEHIALRWEFITENKKVTRFRPRKRSRACFLSFLHSLKIFGDFYSQSFSASAVLKTGFLNERQNKISVGSLSDRL